MIPPVIGDAGAPTPIDGGQPPAIDAGAIDAGPASTCGGDFQRACLDRYSNEYCGADAPRRNVDHVCQPCGGNGQITCLDRYNNAYCLDGFTRSPSDGKCHPR